jgi:short-subunit dehydrogenase
MVKSKKKPVALVTGASQGIGAAVAKRLAEAGYEVFGGSRKMPAIPGVTSLDLDVTAQGSVDTAIAEVMRKASRIDLLVNNAGYGLTGGIEETSVAQAKALFETNFFGAMRMAKAVVPIMRAQGYGRILNTSSVLGFLPAPFSGIYGASKFALEGFSESLDHELRHLDVRSILIEPGFTASSFSENTPKADTPLPAYVDVRRHMDAVIANSLSGGVHPDVVAEVVLKVARLKNPKVRYTAGKPAGKLAKLRRFLPGRMFENSFRSRFGLNSNGATQLT